MLLPDWCTPLPDARQMRAIDRWAIDEEGVPSLELMERAGLGVAQAVERLAPDGPVAILCGKGNNGGDGLVVARRLREAGRQVTVLCVGGAPELSADARANLERLEDPQPSVLDAGLGGPARDALARATVIVDALLGTGFEGAPRGIVAEAIEAIDAAPGAVLSVDVPSGVDASTGVVAGAAVRATRTVSFHAGKPGLWIHPGKAHAGCVEVLDIGIPRGAPAQAQVGLIEDTVLAQLPHRGAGSTKFSSGHVVVVGGSRDLSGAPRMTALAAMRAGAGYVTACLPRTLQPALAASMLEVMTRGLPDEDDGAALTPAGVQTVLEALGRRGALALGPGLGRSAPAQELARELVARAPVAMVLDADGLGAFAGRLEELAGRGAPSVLTPHAGELARLLGRESEEIARERLQSVREAAARAQATVVLKGDDTLVAEPSGRVAISPGGSPALATAGTGDVLSGVLAALLSQGLDPFTAACAGVSMHAQAGREAARRQGSAEGVIASDVIAALPAARAGRRQAGAPGTAGAA